jgi:hypothetical protein
MQLIIPHSMLGDKEIDFDTETEEGRKKLGETLNKLLRAGTAIFLERADKTYRITGWDPSTDKLIVQNPYPQESTALAVRPTPSEDETVDRSIVCSCQKCTGCGTFVSERSKTGICSPCQQGKHGGTRVHKTREKIRANPRRGRMTAIANTAGG